MSAIRHVRLTCTTGGHNKEYAVSGTDLRCAGCREGEEREGET
jgi:hypothetical protein